MIEEEKYIVSRFGKENHFSVPDNYFDSFKKQFIEGISDISPERSEQHSTTFWYRFRPIVMVAASLCIVLFSLVTYFYVNNSHRSAHTDIAVNAQTSSDTYLIDQTADYSMLDNEDIYACVSDN